VREGRSSSGETLDSWCYNVARKEGTCGESSGGLLFRGCVGVEEAVPAHLPVGSTRRTTCS
jgi:hypothetical protein